MTKFTVIIRWSCEDEVFVAEAPELAGCAADGTTRGEAVDNLETVIREWIETARSVGRAIPQSESKTSNARFDKTRAHRFWLKRVWDASRPTVVFVMLNPSDGDEAVNDSTIKSCIRKAKFNKYGALEIVNLYSLVARRLENLWQAQRAGITIVHARNDRWIKRTCRGRTVVLACGAEAETPRLNAVLALLKAADVVPLCVGRTSGAFPKPRHPLYVRDDVTFQKF